MLTTRLSSEISSTTSRRGYSKTLSLFSRSLAVAADQLDGKATAADGVPADWESWLRYFFPGFFPADFADHHRDFWEWVESIRPGVKPSPFVAIWARGGAKSTNLESAVVRLGAKRSRSYFWYISETQELADKHVATIKSMLESRRIEEHYPELGQPRLTRIGVRAGWTRSVVRTAAGVTIESIGLDKAVRGARELENRPDFIAFDDIDGLEDTFATIEKKERTILQTILPAGSGDAAVAIVQNLITDRGIVARLAGIADQVVDYLQGRIVSGPHPAVRNLRLEMVEDEWRIVDGEPTWDGQSLETCQNQIAEWGPTAFLSEAQHDVFARSGGMFDKDYFDIVPELPSGRNLEFCRYWDKAGTRDAGAHTAGLLLARDGSTFYIVDLEMGQWEAPERERRILRTAHLDEERFGAFGSIRTGVEQEPGSSGKESAESTVRMLSEEGFSAFADSPTGDKVLRAEPVAKLAELGAIKMVAGAYNDRLLRILHGFPKGTIKDPVDALSGAYKKLSRSSNSAEIARRLGRVERFSSPWLRER